jgi:hypothetical protein
VRRTSQRASRPPEAIWSNVMDNPACPTGNFDLVFDPIDWQQLELLAGLTPARRVLTMMQAQAFAMAGLRGTFHRRFPELSQSELNLKVLSCFTPLRGICVNVKPAGKALIPPPGPPPLARSRVSGEGRGNSLSHRPELVLSGVEGRSRRTKPKDERERGLGGEGHT